MAWHTHIPPTHIYLWRRAPIWDHPQDLWDSEAFSERRKKKRKKKRRKKIPCYSLKQPWDIKIKIMKTCQILVDPGATLSTSNTPQSLQMGSWKTGRSQWSVEIFTRVCSPESVCDAWWRVKNKIWHCPFLFKSRPIGYQSLVSQRTEVTFLVVLFGVLRTWLSDH